MFTIENELNDESKHQTNISDYFVKLFSNLEPPSHFNKTYFLFLFNVATDEVMCTHIYIHPDFL